MHYRYTSEILCQGLCWSFRLLFTPTLSLLFPAHTPLLPLQSAPASCSHLYTNHTLGTSPALSVSLLVTDPIILSHTCCLFSHYASSTYSSQFAVVCLPHHTDWSVSLFDLRVSLHFTLPVSPSKSFFCQTPLSGNSTVVASSIMKLMAYVS